MNQNSFIIILSVVLVSCTKIDHATTLQITSESAAEIISSQDPLLFQLDTTAHQENDSIFSLLFVEPDIIYNEFHFFLEHKKAFYLFQEKKIIYHNSGREFYKNENVRGDNYYFYSDKGKSYYRIKLTEDAELAFLVKHAKKNKAKDLIEFETAELRSKKALLCDRVPLLEINTFNTPLTDADYQNAEVKMITNNETTTVASKLKIRGSSSKVFPKKQLALKTLHQSYFKDIIISKSVLYAPYSDKSLIRNKLSYDLYAKMSSVSNPSIFTNVLLNGDYYGLYLLLEHPRQQYAKLINNLDTNSFLVQIDRAPCDIVHYKKLEKGINAAYVIESPSNYSAQKRTQIDRVLSAFEEAILNDDLSLMDTISFMDFIILNELSKNIDAYRLSTYLVFDGTKLGLPIAWDYNIAWGLAEHGNAFSPEGFVIDGDYSDHLPFWWNSLWENKKFNNSLKRRYITHRKSVLRNDNIGQLIEQFENTLSAHQPLNFKKWPLMGKKIWPNKYKSQSHKEELDLLKTWIKRRLIWLDQQWGTNAIE